MQIKHALLSSAHTYQYLLYTTPVTIHSNMASVHVLVWHFIYEYLLFYFWVSSLVLILNVVCSCLWICLIIDSYLAFSLLPDLFWFVSVSLYKIINNSCACKLVVIINNTSRPTDKYIHTCTYTHTHTHIGSDRVTSYLFNQHSPYTLRSIISSPWYILLIRMSEFWCTLIDFCLRLSVLDGIYYQTLYSIIYDY